MTSKTSASSLAGGVQFATGTYTGDGAATQAIVGVGFQPKFVVIYKNVGGAVSDVGFKTDQDGLNAKVWHSAIGGWRYEADHIVSLDATGFTVGDGTPLGTNILNINLQVYTYIAFR